MNEPFDPPKSEITPGKGQNPPRKSPWIESALPFFAPPMGLLAAFPWMGLDPGPLRPLVGPLLSVPAVPLSLLGRVSGLPFLMPGSLYIHAGDRGTPVLTPLGLALAYGLPPVGVLVRYLIRRRSRAARP